MTLLLFLIACKENAPIAETLDVSCNEIVYQEHYNIVTIDHPEKILTWSSMINAGGGWQLEPDAVWLTNEGDFILSSTVYCQDQDLLRLTWWQ